METYILRPKLIMPKTRKINFRFSVKRRLQDDAKKDKSLKPKRDALLAELATLDITGNDPDKWQDVQRSYFIERELRGLQIERIMPPLGLDLSVVPKTGELRQFLVNQFAELDVPEKLAWLDTFSDFIMTPDIHTAYKKIADIVSDYQPIGQQFNLLIGGLSGSGKTSLLQLLLYCNPPFSSGPQEICPFALLDASPFETSKRAFARRLIRGSGDYYHPDEREDDLFPRATGSYVQSRTVLVGVEEAHLLATSDLRPRFIDFSNSCPCSIVCTSSEPETFIHGHLQTGDRWRKPFILKPYSGERLTNLLGYFDLLLPFPEDSNLALTEILIKKGKEKEEGPAMFIEQQTKGNLKDILRLVVKCSKTALKSKRPKLTLPDLRKTAEDIWG